LQYAHARARSVLAKSTAAPVPPAELQPGERSLARKIGEYPEAVSKAVSELMPHHICTYLYELAQVFNRFYEHNRVVGDEREAARLQLVSLYAEVLKDGLELLGITAPNKM
jgi:arginyl-tRNA synthetase